MFSKEEIKNAWKVANNYGIRYFSAVGTNAKTIKSDKKTEYLTLIMYMAPSTQAGKKYNTCPMASKGCSDACLFTAGYGQQESVKNARILRTKFWFEHRNEFKICLFSELLNHRNRCKRQGKKPAVRLNGTSDIVWEKQFPELFEYFNDFAFYDYTKFWQRLMNEYKLPKNYHLTLSKSESNDDEIKKVLKSNKNANIAVVFDEVPEKWNGRKVIIGDEHDLRILDPKGVIVGLKEKGDAKDDNSGFVVRLKTTELTVKGKQLITV
jgi:hypothetical protein